MIQIVSEISHLILSLLLYVSQILSHSLGRGIVQWQIVSFTSASVRVRFPLLPHPLPIHRQATLHQGVAASPLGNNGRGIGDQSRSCSSAGQLLTKLNHFMTFDLYQIIN